MTQLKYIIYDTGAFLLPVVFPSTIDHRTMFEDVAVGLFANSTIYSAGFYAYGDCYGKSMTLGVENKDGDAIIINEFASHEGVKQNIFKLFDDKGIIHD